jgi:quercetin dioxygenase-like cupin family protein
MSQAPILIESLKDNNGRRTISQAVFPPGAECPMHYHTEFEETFEVLEGEFTVFIGKTKLTLTTGQSTPKIKTNENHYFKNSSKKNVVVNIISEPGHAGGENATKILSGLERDGKYSLLTKFNGYNTLWIVLFDMTNTLLTATPKVIFNILVLFHGNSKIQRLRQDLLDKYCK